MSNPHRDRPVVGRLAPSPTGALHLGNLSTSLLAWAQARHASGSVLLRIEDLDPPRVVAGAADEHIADLRWLGLDWDGGPDIGGSLGPWFQSTRDGLYQQAADALLERDLLYPCGCSRAEIRDVLSAPHAEFDPRTLYPGTCAHIDAAGRLALPADVALRFRAHGRVCVDDRLAGQLDVDLAVEPGDFVVRRRDGLWAYQLAVVVDDIAMGVTDVVRGRDLLSSTPRQFAIFDALDAPRPATWHVPLLVDARGARLAKRDGSMARAGLEHVGWTAELLRGALMRLWGWRHELAPASADEVVAAFSPRGLSRREIRVPDAFFEGPRAFAAVAYPPEER